MTNKYNEVKLEPEDLEIVLKLYKSNSGAAVAAELTEIKGGFITDQQVYAFLRNARRTMLAEINNLVEQNRIEEADKLKSTVETMFPRKRKLRAEKLNRFVFDLAGINID